MQSAYQILKRFNQEYPNNGFIYDPEVTSDTQVDSAIIDYLNSALMRLDKVALLDELYEIPTIAGQNMYELPLDCEMSNIVEISRQYGATAVRCRYARDGELMYGNRYFNAYGNMLGIYPTPTKDGDKITVVYKHTPRPVKTLDDPVEVADKWIDLLVFSMVADVTAGGNNPDIELSNNYRDRHNALLQNALLERTTGQPYYPKVKDNKRPFIGYLRRGWRC